MSSLADSLLDEGYQVSNVDYPSRKFPIEALAPIAVEKGLASCADSKRIHFVTHSMGGILLRQYLSAAPSSSEVSAGSSDQNPVEINEVLREQLRAKLGHTVMLGPPNQGSEIVDRLRDTKGFFKWWNGPAGLQLGTDDESVPKNLPSVDFSLGVIAGSKPLTPFLTGMLPKPNDGKVSAESAKVEGMKDYRLLPVTHTFMMNDEMVIRQVKHFLVHGQFQSDKNVPIQ